MIIKPMLAGKCNDINKLRYPVICSPKLDGIRCLLVDGKAVSRTFKPIPNQVIRDKVESLCIKKLDLDGELIIPKKSFQETTSAVMGKESDNQEKIRYFIFDSYSTNKEEYQSRIGHLQLFKNNFAIIVSTQLIHGPEELQEFEQECLSNGYEGVMIRDPKGPYKFGRSTEKEGYLLKLKRFEDSEAIIIDFEEMMHNDNIAEKDAFGRTKRSTSKENLVPKGTLGKLVVKDVKTGVVFGVGTGFDDELRAKVWRHRADYKGTLITYKFQPFGVKEAPRCPVFKGFRDIRDM